MSAEGSAHAVRGQLDQPYINDGDPGPFGGGTYTNSGIEPTVEDYENVFGPAARDIKFDSQRAKRHQRWHLPDVLRGPNPFLTDRVDGLITDATNSPFTTVILPYQYVPNPDAKLKWNVWSFDEGMASRVPYESAARVLTQTKKSFAGYVVRQGLAITMEHNFMKSPAGMENFRNQLKQLVGSIQYTNDLDVHMALIQAPSYARTIAEKYFNNQKTALQLCREYIDLFGIIQKTPNALDLLIEEAKGTLRNWGSNPPSFLLTNGKLTMQLQMSPERTSYVTQGYDGMKRLRTGPDIDSYRGLNIIKSRCFSTEAGMAPRDPLCRRVRVAEYYRIIPDDKIEAWMLYDQSKDTWFEVTLDDLWNYSELNPPAGGGGGGSGSGGFPGGAGAGGGGGPFSLPPEGGNNQGLARYSIDEWLRQPASFQTFRDACRGSFELGDLFFQTDIPDNAYAQAVFAMQSFDGMHDDGTDNYQNVVRFAVHITAWIGGGIFNDLMASHITSSNDLYRIDQWSGLAETDSVIHKQVQEKAKTDSDFKAYRPNLVYSSFDDNDFCISNDSILQLAFANVKIREVLLQYLLQKVESKNVTTHCDEAAKLLLHNNKGNPTLIHSRLFACFTAFFYPNVKVRQTVLSEIDPVYQVLSKICETYWNEYKKNTSTDLDSCTELFYKDNQFTDNKWNSDSEQMLSMFNLTLQLQNLDFNTHTKSFDSRYESSHSILAAAVMIFTKRIFGFAGRYMNGYYKREQGIALICKHLPRSHFDTNNPQFVQNASASFHPSAWLGVSHPPGLQPAPHDPKKDFEYVIIRPNIEHEMLGIIMGRGGSGELGATLWGQTELSCYDDSQHGVWGMSYKYHERAQVFNEKNMIRLWDVAFNGYNGGMDDSVAKWDDASMENLRTHTNDLSKPYQGPSMIVMRFRKGGAQWQRNWPSPIVFYDHLEQADDAVTADPECIHNVTDNNMRVFKNNANYERDYMAYKQRLPDFGAHHKLRKPAGHASANDETSSLAKLAFQGSLKARLQNSGQIIDVQTGCGHLGPSYVGVASVREGKGYKQQGAPTLGRLV